MNEIKIQNATVDMSKIGISNFKQEFGVEAILTLTMIGGDLREFQATTKDGIAELVSAAEQIKQFACDNPL